MPITADLIASTRVQVLQLRTSIRRKGLDILFVHGSLRNDTASARGSRGTWMQRDNPHVCWPEVWLHADLGFIVRILSVSYDDVALRKKDIPKEEIADAIAHELFQILFPRTWASGRLMLDTWGLGTNRPVVLVGHEFGGDVIKSLVMEAKGIVTNTRPPRSSTPEWKIMSLAEAFVQNVVQIVVYARQRVHDNWELNKDGSIDDSCSLFVCNPKSRFVQGIEPFPSWEEKGVWSLDSPGEHGDVWKPPNKSHESYSLLLESLLQARDEDLIFTKHRSRPKGKNDGRIASFSHRTRGGYKNLPLPPIIERTNDYIKERVFKYFQNFGDQGSKCQNRGFGFSHPCRVRE